MVRGRLDEARFTADANPATNIDAGTRDDVFTLATGGETKNEGTKLRERMKVRVVAEPPVGLPEG